LRALAEGIDLRWRTFREQQASMPSTDTPTQTMTIDIGHRS
jgi:hypothetical protein